MSGYFLLLPCFIEIPVFNANSVDHDQTQCYVVSDLGRVATHFLFQNSLTFSWLFIIFQTFLTASQLPLQLSSATKYSNRAFTFRELNNHLTKEWSQFCKFMLLKIKETAITISVFRKFWNSLTFPWLLSVFFPISLTQTKIPWLFPDLEKFSFSRLFSLTVTVATLSGPTLFTNVPFMRG